MKSTYYIKKVLNTPNRRGSHISSVIYCNSDVLFEYNINAKIYRAVDEKIIFQVYRTSYKFTKLLQCHQCYQNIDFIMFQSLTAGFYTFYWYSAS